MASCRVIHLASFTQFILTYHALEDSNSIFSYYKCGNSKRNRENDLSHVTELIKGRAASGPFVPDSLKLMVSNSETQPLEEEEIQP